MSRKFFAVRVFTVLCSLSIVSNAQAQCLNATLHGEYKLYTQGVVAPAGTPRVNLAVLTFDSKGNYFSRFVTNDNGTITRGTFSDLAIESTPTGRVTLDAQVNETGVL